MKKGITVEGQKLRAARMAVGLSVRALGALCGRSAVHMSLLERGRSRASEQTLNQVAAALGIPADVLRKGDESI